MAGNPFDQFDRAPAAGNPFDQFDPGYQPKSPGALGHVKDTGLQLAQGVLQGGEMLSNAFGADNPVSEKLRAGHQWLASNFSDQLKWEQLTTAREMDEAAKTGSTWDEVKAAARGFGRDPVGFLVNAAGTSLPTIAAAFLPGGQGALLGRLAAMGAAGAAQGAGAVKGQIFGEVEQAWKEAGATEEEAKTRAAAAQEYLGSNAGQIAIGTALGAVAGATGLEGGLAAKVGGQAAAKTTGMIPRFVREGVKEAIPEAAQGGQEQLAGNLAVQGEGFERSTWGGVAGGATLEGLAGGVVGGAGSMFTRPSQQQRPDPVPDILAATDVDSAIRSATDGVFGSPGAPGLPDTEVTPEQAIMRMEAEAQRDSRLNVSDWSALGGERLPVEPEADWMREARATAEADQQQMADEQRIRAEALAPAPARQILPDLPGGRTWERDLAGITLDAEAAQAQQQKAADLERLPADAAAQNLQQQALQRAAALEGESPMAAALRKAGASQPNPSSVSGNPNSATADASSAAPAQPRIVPRTPDMEPMSLPKAQEMAAKAPGSEVVAIRNRSGKLAYTVLPPEQAAIRPGDILTQDQFPYGTKTAATIRARKEGPEWAAVEVPGGFAVRRKEQSSEPVSSVDDVPGEVAAPGAGGSPTLPRGVGAAGPVPDEPGRVGGPAAAPTGSGGPAGVVAAAGEPDTALNAAAPAQPAAPVEVGVVTDAQRAAKLDSDRGVTRERAVQALRDHIAAGNKFSYTQHPDGSVTASATSLSGQVALNPTAGEKKAMRRAEADLELAETQEERAAAMEARRAAIAPAVERALTQPNAAAPANQPAGVSESPAGAPSAPVAAAPIEGKKIDREWSAFTPDSGTLNIPRAEMPQIRAEHRGAMVNFLNARGIAHEAAEVQASDLKPTQAEFSPAKVAKAKAFTGGDRSILVSSDGHVLDGHHQWMAKRESGEPIKVIRLKAPIKRLLAEVREFPSAETAPGSKQAESAAPRGSAAETKEESQQTEKQRDTLGGGQASGNTAPAATLKQRLAAKREEQAELIALRKRESVLKSIRECLQ